MALNYFTLIHVLISLIAIASGFGFLSGLLTGRILPRWMSCFLVTTLATSVTGFFFPFRGFTPGIGVEIVSLIVLAADIYSLRWRRLAGHWLAVFVYSSVAALYLNFFVLVAQLFQKVPALIAIAPTPSAPVFAVTQAIVLLAFIAMALRANKGMCGAKVESH